MAPLKKYHIKYCPSGIGQRLELQRTRRQWSVDCSRVNARRTNSIEYCGKVLTLNRQWRWFHTG